MKSDESKYAADVLSLGRLIALQPDSFNPSSIRIEDVLAGHSGGGINSDYDLQNYVAGMSSGGWVLGDDGNLDMTKRFVRIDYFSLLEQIRTQNNVQAAVSSKPVHFVAAAIPVEAFPSVLPADVLPIDSAVWLYRDENRQALIVGRRTEDGQLWIRYLPVRGLKQSADGKIGFLPAPWGKKLSLELWENLKMTAEQRLSWLESWQPEHDWMEAVYATRYSNGVIGLHDQFVFSPVFPFQTKISFCGFTIGNGGSATGIPHGVTVDRPYDSFNFLPTIFRLTGQITDQGLSQGLIEKGFRPFPGSPIQELFDHVP